MVRVADDGVTKDAVGRVEQLQVDREVRLHFGVGNEGDVERLAGHAVSEHQRAAGRDKVDAISAVPLVAR